MQTMIIAYWILGILFSLCTVMLLFYDLGNEKERKQAPMRQVPKARSGKKVYIFVPAPHFVEETKKTKEKKAVTVAAVPVAPPKSHTYESLPQRIPGYVWGIVLGGALIGGLVAATPLLQREQKRQSTCVGTMRLPKRVRIARFTWNRRIRLMR